MKPIIIWAAVCLIIPAVLFSQKPVGNFGHLSIGYSHVAHKNLEAAFRQNNRFGNNFSLHPSAFTIGGGYYTLKKNGLLFGGNTAVSKTKSFIRTNYGTETITSAGFFNLGYSFARSKNFFSYVMGGIGGGFTKMKVDNGSGTAPIIMDANSQVNAGSAAKYLISSPGFEAAMGFKLLLFAEKKRKHVSALTIGLDLGYANLPFKERPTDRQTDKQVSGFPEMSINTWYLRMTIGGGKFGFIK
jgi:hypothetical protein